MSEAATRTTRTLGISGMTCNNCVNHVTKALMGTPGVTKATVDLKREVAVVEHGPNVAAASLVAAVEAAGYGVREPDAAAAKAGWRFWRK